MLSAREPAVATRTPASAAALLAVAAALPRSWARATSWLYRAAGTLAGRPVMAARNDPAVAGRWSGLTGLSPVEGTTWSGSPLGLVRVRRSPLCPARTVPASPAARRPALTSLTRSSTEVLLAVGV